LLTPRPHLKDRKEPEGRGEEGTERDMGREDMVKGRQRKRIGIAHPLVSA